MRGFLIFLGVLLVLAGGTVAAAQYAPLDLSMLDSVQGAKAFLTSQMALYAGGGAAGFGLLLIIIAAATGGKKKAKPVRKTAPAKAEPQKAAAPEPAPRKPEPVQAAPAPKPAPQPALQTVAAAPRPAPAVPAPSPSPAPAPAPAQAQAVHKPTASAQPPASASSAVQDPRLLNRKRVQDLVTINDALKAYQQKHGAYPKAGGLVGYPERGAAWIPGLAPDFLKALPRDPAMSDDKAGPQYVYVSDGTDYKLLAQGVSLVGGTNVEVLGVRIDMTRQPTPENASFGFWTPGFASA